MSATRVNTAPVLVTMSVPELLVRLEADIYYGCHSTRAEASRSFARKELRHRGEKAIAAIVVRLQEMAEQPLEDECKKSVRDGLALTLYWMTSSETRRTLSPKISEILERALLSR